VWVLATQVSCVNLITQDFSASFCSLEFPGEFLLTRDFMEKHLSRTKPFLFFSYSIVLAVSFAVFLFVGISARRQNLLRSSLLKVHTYKLIYEARCATRQLICHHGTCSAQLHLDCWVVSHYIELAFIPSFWSALTISHFVLLWLTPF
jgi:hypothetical protein